MSVIDTHCHLDITREFGIEIQDSLAEAQKQGLEALVQIATSLKSSEFNRTFAREQNESGGKPEIYWTAGMHPESAKEIETLPELLQMVRDNYQEPNFLGMGETGLDYFHTTDYVKEQKESLEAHFALAQELKLPVVLHLRDDRHYVPGKIGAVTDCLEILKSYPDVRGVLHCFTYGYDEAKPFVDLGWMVSYSGILTFKSAVTVQDGAGRLPLEHLMVETDAPFLAPAPFRGKTNQPAYVVHTLDYLCKLRKEKQGEDEDLVRKTIYENSKKFLNWKNTL